MGKKGKKTRWRKLPMAIGEGRQNDDSEMDESTYAVQSRHHHNGFSPQPFHQQQHHHHHHQQTHYHQSMHRYQNHQSHHAHQPSQPVTQSTFNEEEYTKITTPRQDMLFKKGYLGKKRATSNPPQDVTDNQSAGSIESENYACEEPAPQYVYPYVDSTGAYYFNTSGYEVFDPYTGAVAVIFGPGPAGYGPNGAQPVLAAVPCQPVPLQPVEWFSPVAQQSAPAPLCLPSTFVPRKKRHSVDSQNCSGQSSESNCPLGSPQESVENVADQNGINSTQYVYPSMFGAPVYNVNGVSVQGLVPPCAPPAADQAKRRKKRKRRKRGGVTDEGSESSCEEANSCEVNGEIQSGSSSDTAVGSSSSSKTNSDSGIQTDPAAYSGTDSPQIPDVPPFFADSSPKVTNEAVEASRSTSDVSRGSEIAEGSTVPDASAESQCADSETAAEAVPREFVGIDLETETVSVPPAASPLNVPEAESSQPVDAVENAVVNESVPNETQETATIHDSAEDQAIEGVNQGNSEPELQTSLSIEENTEELSKGVDSLSLTEPVEETSLPERPITKAVTKWLQSQGNSALTPFVTDSDDEGIEEGEDPLDTPLTGSKNVKGNPCPALSPSDAESRVAPVEIEMNDVDARVRHMCDPRSSVSKYYRLTDERSLASDDRSGHVFASTAPVILKTAVHIGRSGPFPCGICCMIQ